MICRTRSCSSDKGDSREMHFYGLVDTDFSAVEMTCTITLEVEDRVVLIQIKTFIGISFHSHHHFHRSSFFVNTSTAFGMQGLPDTPSAKYPLCVSGKLFHLYERLRHRNDTTVARMPARQSCLEWCATSENGTGWRRPRRTEGCGNSGKYRFIRPGSRGGERVQS